MRKSLPALAALLITAIPLLPLVAQEPGLDGAALGAALQGKVESLGEDLRLRLRYPFERMEELQDFATDGVPVSAARIEGGHLHLERDEEAERHVLHLRGLHFDDPLRLQIEVAPQWEDSGLMVGLADTSERRGMTWVVWNGRLGDDDGQLRHGVLRYAPAAGSFPVMTRTSPGGVKGQSYRLELRLEESSLEVSLDGKLILVDRFFAHDTFEIVIGATGPAIWVTELLVDGVAVADSLRKVLKGRAAAASEAGRELEQGRTSAQALAVERILEPLSREMRREFRELPDGVRERVAAAWRTEGEREFADAALAYAEAASLAPGNAAVAWRAGWCLLHSGEPEEARRAFEAALEVDSELPQAWRDLGSALEILERPVEALQAFETAVELAPRDPLLLAEKGLFHLGRGELEEAEKLLRMAEALAPGRPAYGDMLATLERLRSPPEWKKSFEAETSRYRVTTDVSAAFATETAELLEKYRKFLEGVLGTAERADKKRSEVWIFDSRGDYNVFAGTMTSPMIGRTAGVYHPGIRTLLLFDAVDREATYDTLFHEGFHQYLDLITSNAPIWFNEGMAEVFGSCRVDAEGAVGLGVQLGRLAELRHTLATEPERIGDLDRLMLTPKMRFYDPESVGLNYAVAWSLCHYFFTGPNAEARRLFRVYTARVLAGDNLDAAHAATFGAEGARSAESFRRSWLRWVRRL